MTESRASKHHWTAFSKRVRSKLRLIIGRRFAYHFLIPYLPFSPQGSSRSCSRTICWQLYQKSPANLSLHSFIPYHILNSYWNPKFRARHRVFSNAKHRQQFVPVCLLTQFHGVVWFQNLIVRLRAYVHWMLFNKQRLEWPLLCFTVGSISSGS